MPAAARTNLYSGPTRRSPRLKSVRRFYDEDSDTDSSTFKRVKTEVIDVEEVVSPSTSELNVTSVSGKDCGQDFHDVSLKDLRARCKARNSNTCNNTFEGSGICILTEITREEFDLDKPLIALKKKKQNKSPAKANGEIDAQKSSPCAVTVEDTMLNRDKICSPGQSYPLEVTGHDSATKALERRAQDLEHPKITTDCDEEIIVEKICHVEFEGTSGAVVTCGNSDLLTEIKMEDIEHSKEFGTFSCSRENLSECSSFELPQELIKGDECRPQPSFISQLTEVADASDQSCELMCTVKESNFDETVATEEGNIVSSHDSIYEASDNQKPSENIANSDMDKSSIENGFLVCSLNQSCYGHNDDHWNTGAIEGNDLDSIKALEELSPIDESNTDMVSPLVSIHSDLFRSTEMKCTSFEEVVEMQTEGQLNSIVCRGARPKQMLLGTEVEHATSDYTYDFDKTVELAQPVNFNTQDGQLESIVYDALNNHSQRMISEERTFKACVDKESTRGVTSEFLNSEETQKIPVGVTNSSFNSAETDGPIQNSESFIDEESGEEHAPRKLFSKREIMSPVSQEKLCNALTDIDLCDSIKRLKKNIVLEDSDKTRSTDRRLQGKTCISPTIRVLKSAESLSHQQTACSCMKSSPVDLDTKKAVEFSQRQMHDIENIAAKLIRSLKQMKSIVDESLSSEAYSLVPNLRTAEIRAASEDALEVEKTTKKWLAIMNKDCNRFCKILTLAKKNTVSHPEAPRRERKITFADEAGGKLCHIKVFKDGQTSLSERENNDL
ncbi:hypothetical protein ACP4OV_016339 [Aristida adscensionis]